MKALWVAAFVIFIIGSAFVFAVTLHVERRHAQEGNITELFALDGSTGPGYEPRAERDFK